MFASSHSVISRVPCLIGDDAVFLQQMMSKFPRVGKGFSEFVAIDPRGRISKAAQILEQQPRSGWDRLGVVHGSSDVLRTHRGEYHGDRWLLFEGRGKTGETVLRHSIELVELYVHIFKRGSHVQLAAEVLKFHDFIEAINGDFTPHDPISRPEKARLERIALELLTESRTSGDLLALHVYNCMRIFEGDVTDFAPLRKQMRESIDAQSHNRNKPFVRFVEDLYVKALPDLALLREEVKDIDTLQMGVCGIHIIRDEHFTVSKEVAHKKMDEFWDYINKKLTTHHCRIFFEELTELYKNAEHLSGQASLLVAHGLMLNRLDIEEILRRTERRVA